MNKKIEGLLDQLRDAIHEALADSRAVAQVMADLEQERCCPMFSVDVTLAEPPADGTFSEALMLTEYDQEFLRVIKITALA